MTADDYYPFLHAQLFHFVIWTRKGFFTSGHAQSYIRYPVSLWVSFGQ